MIVGENTCDGKKKSYELFAKLVHDLYVMDMPQVKSAQGRALLRAEYARFLARMEELVGRPITAGDLQRGIAQVNAKRAALHRLDARQTLTDGGATTVEGLLDAIVDRYLTIDCAIFTPNPSRLDHIRTMAAAAEADGVMHYGLQFCHPYQIEAGPVEQALEEGCLPTLRVDTDYSPEDAEQIRTRVEAFLERLQG